MELRNSVLSSQAAILATPSTHLATLLVKGSNSLDIYLARFLPQMFSATITPIVVIIVIGSQDVISGFIAFVTLPLIPIFGALIGRYTKDAVTAKWQSLGTLSKYFEDSLRGIFTLAIFGRHKSQGERIREMGDRYTDETMKVLRISFLSALVLELAATISVAVIAVSIGLRLVGGSMEFLPALIVLVLAPEVFFPLRNAASLFHASADGGAALSQLNNVKNSPASNRVSGSKTLDDITSIEWSKWRSPYTDAHLDGHSLKSGEILVLLGGSGLGKTTFLNSILGFNSSAGVRINSEEIATFDQRALYNQIGWIKRPESDKEISDVISDIKNCGEELFLFDDDSFTGGTFKKASSLIGENLILGYKTLIKRTDEEIADIRDFIIGAKFGGLVVRLPNGKIGRVPYFMPFSCPSTRASIPFEFAQEFSVKMLELNKEILSDKKLGDLPEPNREIFYLMGFCDNSSMNEVILSVLNIVK
jgi:hypothetical protein